MEVMKVENKTPIEIALKIDDDGFTLARNLYDFLELNPANYSHWVKRNILENEFALEDQDYLRFVVKDETPTGGKIKREDYKISADFAKKLSMTAKTKRGEEARTYFIGCEQALKRVAEQRRQTELERAKGIAVRQALTKAIQQSTENERMHGHAYSTYTDVVYRSVFGKTAKQLREEYGIQKTDNLRDCFSQEELQQVQNAEMLVSSLVGYGWGYDEIRDFLYGQAQKRISA